MLVERNACYHVANAFLSRLELIWLIFRLKKSKKAFFPKCSRWKWVKVVYNLTNIFCTCKMNNFSQMKSACTHIIWKKMLNFFSPAEILISPRYLHSCLEDVVKNINTPSYDYNFNSSTEVFKQTFNLITWILHTLS